MSGNIGAGKTTLCDSLAKFLPNTMYIPEVFATVKDLELMYAEMQGNKLTGAKYNKYQLSVLLDFLDIMAANETNINSINDKNILMDRCVFEQYHIFAKNSVTLGNIKRISNGARDGDIQV